MLLALSAQTEHWIDLAFQLVLILLAVLIVFLIVYLCFRIITAVMDFILSLVNRKP